MALALYLTIWTALGLFAAGETGRRRSPHTGASDWAWWLSLVGLVLAVVHFILAYEVRHDWRHASAIRDTARQTMAVYGIDWGGGVYVNYVFLAVWGIDLWRWRRGQGGTRAVSPGTWAARVVYLVVILNAAVIFASGMRRGLGLLVVVWLVMVWARERRGAPGS